MPLEEAQCKQVERAFEQFKSVNNNEHTINWIWCNESRVARLAEDKGHEIVGVIDRTSKASTPYSQYQHISECKVMLLLTFQILVALSSIRRTIQFASCHSNYR